MPRVKTQKKTIDEVISGISTDDQFNDEESVVDEVVIPDLSAESVGQHQNNAGRKRARGDHLKSSNIDISDDGIAVQPVGITSHGLINIPDESVITTNPSHLETAIHIIHEIDSGHPTHDDLDDTRNDSDFSLNPAVSFAENEKLSNLAKKEILKIIEHAICSTGEPNSEVVIIPKKNLITRTQKNELMLFINQCLESLINTEAKVSEYTLIFISLFH